MSAHTISAGAAPNKGTQPDPRHDGSHVNQSCRRALDAGREVAFGCRVTEVFMKRIIVSLIFVTFSLAVVALPQKKGAEKSPCEGNGTQAEANACARFQYTQADVEMNRVYEQLMSELAGDDDKNQQKLRQAQLLWLQYRDANCESEASIYEGGSIRPAIYNHCLASVTRERTGRLRAFLGATR